MFWARERAFQRQRFRHASPNRVSVGNDISENLAHLKEQESVSEGGWFHSSIPALTLLKSFSAVELVPLVIRSLCLWPFLAQSVIRWISLCFFTSWDIMSPSFCSSQRFVHTSPCAQASADCYCSVSFCPELASELSSFASIYTV